MTTNNPFPRGFRPMKGALVEVDKLRFDHMVASPKIDGYRLCVGGDGVPYTSSLKPFSNKYIRDYFAKLPLALTRYLDGVSFLFQLYPKASIFRPTGANHNMQWVSYWTIEPVYRMLQ